MQAAAVTGLACCGVSGCTQAPRPTGPGGTTVTVDISQPAYAALASTGGAAYAANPNDPDRAIIVYRAAADKVNAFSSRCTHQGGQVLLPSNGLAICSLHGSQFSTDGTYIQGLAPTSLPAYTAVLSGTIITITVT
jgi:cytochrome b6-f complex iron-sulfur subunit